jgi:hypothetical protein
LSDGGVDENTLGPNVEHEPVTISFFFPFSWAWRARCDVVVVRRADGDERRSRRDDAAASQKP